MFPERRGSPGKKMNHRAPEGKKCRKRKIELEKERNKNRRHGSCRPPSARDRIKEFQKGRGNAMIISSYKSKKGEEIKTPGGNAGKGSAHDARRRRITARPRKKKDIEMVGKERKRSGQVGPFQNKGVRHGRNRERTAKPAG